MLPPANRAAIHRIPGYPAWRSAAGGAASTRAGQKEARHRNNVYHPDFGGRFGLKFVAPVLLERGYEGLEITDGNLASMKLEQMLLHPQDLEGDVAVLREQLLAYCHRDTVVLVELHDKLEELASGQ